MGSGEWLEFNEIGTIKAGSHYGKRTNSPRQPLNSSSEHAVGCHTCWISAVAQKNPSRISSGIIFKNHREEILLAECSTDNERKSTVRLVLEGIRHAQLIAKKNRLEKIIFLFYVKEIESILHSHSGFPLEVATIAEDILLLKSLFQDCTFLLTSQQDNVASRKLANYGLECSNSCVWTSHFSAWLR